MFEQTKECLQCKEVKPFSCYHADLAKKDKTKNKCKSCIGIALRQRYVKISEKQKEYSKQYYDKNKEILWEKHKDKILARAKEWSKLNKEKVNAHAARSRIKRMSRFNIQVSLDEQERINCLYSVAKMLSQAGTEKYHVDHIVPLQGKKVSGLHVYENLRVIPASVNLAKGNKYYG